jgi:NAD(P)-dependent dehydrogenase (short-subunit alcohol dehydrogenase family)
LDVTQDESVSNFVKHALEQEGRIDALLNNAGFGIAGAVEDTAIEEYLAQFESNFFGAVRMCQEVLPVMRKQTEGLIINISSLAGKVAVPFQSAYSASKFALEGFSDALRLEVRPFGINVVVVEPGDLSTDFTDYRQISEAAGISSAYNQRFEAALKVMEQDERNGPSPETVARVVERILQSGNPKLRYLVGPTFEQAAVIAKRFLPGKLFEVGLSRYYHLHK